MATPFRYQRGEDVTVLLAIIGDPSGAARVTSVSASLKAAVNNAFVPSAATSVVASFGVTAQLDPSAGPVGWYMVLSAGQAAALSTGTYVTNAELVFDTGAIKVTDPLFIAIAESTASVSAGGLPGMEWVASPATPGTTPIGVLTLCWMGGASSTGVAAAIIGPPGEPRATTAISAGQASAGQVPALNAAGQLDPSLLTGAKGYSNLPQLVLGPGTVAPPSDGAARSINPTAPHQVVASQNDVTLGCTIQETVFGNNRKPMYRTFVKTRGATPSDFSVACQNGDGVFSDLFQASSGGQTAHVAAHSLNVDGAPASGNLGEFPGIFTWSTGTGIQSSVNPGYYGVQDALYLNSRQQMMVPGQVLAAQVIAGTNSYPAYGSSFGAILAIGPGGSAPGQAPLGFDYAHSTLLITPVPGVVEVDSTGAFYITRADSVRRKIVLADPAAPTIAAGSGAGSSPTISIVWNGNGGGRITITTGTGAAADNGTNPTATVTPAHAFPTGCYPTISAASSRAASVQAWTADGSTPGAGFQLYMAGQADGKTYVFNFFLTGF